MVVFVLRVSINLSTSAVERTRLVPRYLSFEVSADQGSYYGVNALQSV